MSRFSESASDYGAVVEIGESRLVLHGGGDFFDEDLIPDDETRAAAQQLADKYGMVITNMRGSWWGYSEYTPDPGNVSVFDWEKKAP
jgi:hypothetical protein